MATSNTILERVFTKKQSGTYSTAIALSGSNYMRHTKCSLLSRQGDIPSSDKTGSIGMSIGSAGARVGEWSLEWECRPNGAAGTAPDADPVLECAFGLKTVDAGVSVTYTPLAAISSFTLGRYRQPSTVMQQLAHGCVVSDLSFAFEQSANCKFTASGLARWVVDSVNYSGLDTTGKGGLGSFPTEPATPVSNGSPLSGLVGIATIDGSTSLSVRSCGIKMATGITLPSDRLFNGQYGSAPERDKIMATMDLVVVDEDQSYVTGLYSKALARTPVDISLQLGDVDGAKVFWALKNCLLPMPALDDSARKWAANLSGIVCHPTTNTSLDELSVSFA